MIKISLVFFGILFGVNAFAGSSWLVLAPQARSVVRGDLCAAEAAKSVGFYVADALQEAGVDMPDELRVLNIKTISKSEKYLFSFDGYDQPVGVRTKVENTGCSVKEVAFIE